MPFEFEIRLIILKDFQFSFSVLYVIIFNLRIETKNMKITLPLDGSVTQIRNILLLVMTKLAN